MRHKSLVLCLAAGAAIGLSTGWYLGAGNVAESIVEVSSSADGPDPEDYAWQAKKGLLSREVLGMEITTPRNLLYTEEMARAPFEDVIETLRNHLDISVKRSSALSAQLSIVLHYRDMAKASYAVASLASRVKRSDFRGSISIAPHLTPGTAAIWAIRRLETRLERLERLPEKPLLNSPPSPELTISWRPGPETKKWYVAEWKRIVLWSCCSAVGLFSVVKLTQRLFLPEHLEYL